MALQPFRVNGQPNPEAMLFNADMIAACYDTNTEVTRAIVHSVGATLHQSNTEVHYSAYGFSVSADDNTIHIAIAGTTAWQQMVLYMASDYITIPYPALRCWAGAWFRYQALGLFERIVASGVYRTGTTKKIQITGHSAGGAIAFLLSLYFLNDGVPKDQLECMTFGECKCAGPTLWGKFQHDRIQCGERINGIWTYDPVPFVAPNSVAQIGHPLALRQIVGTALIGGYVIQHDTPWYYNSSGLTIDGPGDLNAYLTHIVGVGPANIMNRDAHLHSMKTAYIPMALGRYRDAGGNMRALIATQAQVYTGVSLSQETTMQTLQQFRDRMIPAQPQPRERIHPQTLTPFAEFQNRFIQVLNRLEEAESETPVEQGNTMAVATARGILDAIRAATGYEDYAQRVNAYYIANHVPLYYQEGISDIEFELASTPLETIVATPLAPPMPPPVIIPPPAVGFRRPGSF